MSKTEITRAKRGTVPLTFSTPIIDSKLVTKPFAESLDNALGLKTLGDLARHFPRRYEDRTHFTPIAEIQPGVSVAISGAVAGVENIFTNRRMVITKVVLCDDTGSIVLTFFNQWYLKNQFDKLDGQEIAVFGRPILGKSRRIELTDVEWEVIDLASDPLGAQRIVPIYPLGAKIKQARLRKLIYSTLAQLIPITKETLDANIRRRYSLMDAQKALAQAHFPESFEALRDAQRRLIFDEFFARQLALMRRKAQRQGERGIIFQNARTALDELKNVLPFTLTDAQIRVIDEIGGDMASPHPMTRLLQGDVGSGKTVVAAAALLTAARSGYQAALMAPTEILAEQHYRELKRLMQPLDVPVTLLTGSLRPREKADRLQCILDGQYKIVIGTHALIQDSVAFQKLGLVVIDEQHRFGVLQRAALREKAAGHTPDVLVMTATPIPRTLRLSIYGDLDQSVIDALPPGRKRIRTHWKRGAERAKVYETLRTLIRTGRQAYIVCPLVEESEKLQTRAATALAAHLQAEIFPELRIGLLHGQMKSGQKDAVMDAFREGGLDILVATTVIEVGVDVPNASIMVVEDAERFGLAQLHQLRGRVGRGSAQSFCLLIADPKTPEGIARLSVMARTSDGFVIAEEDLRLRGPGDYYGTRQSGMELLPFMDAIDSLSIMHEAREAAQALLGF